MAGYEFTVNIKDGVARVTGDAFSWPDGIWVIGGYEESDSISINVTRKDSAGVFMVEAQHFQKAANYERPHDPFSDGPRQTGQNQWRNWPTGPHWNSMDEALMHRESDLLAKQREESGLTKQIAPEAREIISQGRSVLDPGYEDSNIFDTDDEDKEDIPQPDGERYPDS